MRSSPLIWIFACMYALSAQMCCCQRAELAGLLAFSTQSISASADAGERAACCPRCAEAKAAENGAPSQKDPRPASCDDCGQCHAAAHLDGGVSKNFDSLSNATDSLHACVVINDAAALCGAVSMAAWKRTLSIERNVAVRLTLLDLHCALRV